MRHLGIWIAILILVAMFSLHMQRQNERIAELEKGLVTANAKAEMLELVISQIVKILTEPIEQRSPTPQIVPPIIAY